jgi:hypothetical protein
MPLPSAQKTTLPDHVRSSRDEVRNVRLEDGDNRLEDRDVRVEDADDGYCVASELYTRDDELRVYSNECLPGDEREAATSLS